MAPRGGGGHLRNQPRYGMVRSPELHRHQPPPITSEVGQPFTKNTANSRVRRRGNQPGWL